MQSKSKKDKKAIAFKGVISPEVKDYSKDPFIVKKNEEAKKTIEKYGLPKEFFDKDK